MKHLPESAHILDAGCGVGRDTKYFLKKGYKVTAFDASIEMVNLASKETGLNIQNFYFQEMDFNQEFDGIWAQASLLHVSYDETRSVYEKIHRSLKPGGIFYASYKYGQNYAPTKEKDFWNMDEQTILPYLGGLFSIIDILSISDRRNENITDLKPKWLNFIGRKI